MRFNVLVGAGILAVAGVASADISIASNLLNAEFEVAAPAEVTVDGAIGLADLTADIVAGETSAVASNESFVGLRTVPAPGAAALLGLGGLVIGRRRR